MWFCYLIYILIINLFINEPKTDKRKNSGEVAGKTQELKYAVLQESREVPENLRKD